MPTFTLARYTIRYKGAHQPLPHLIVRYVEAVALADAVVALDGEVAALVEQWHDGGHALRGCVELVGCGFHAPELRWQKMQQGCQCTPSSVILVNLS